MSVSSTASRPAAKPSAAKPSAPKSSIAKSGAASKAKSSNNVGKPAAIKTQAPTRTPASAKVQAASRARAGGIDAAAKARVRQQSQVNVSGPNGSAKAGPNKVEAKGHLAKITDKTSTTKIGVGEAKASLDKNGGRASAKGAIIESNIKTPDGGKAKIEVGKGEVKVSVGKDGVSAKGKVTSVEGTYTNKKGDLKITGRGPSAGAELDLKVPGRSKEGSVTKKGDAKPSTKKGTKIGVKMGVSLGEVEATKGKSDPTKSTDTKVHGGLRAGAKVGGSVSQTDTDGDGKPEFTAKIHAGPISIGITQEGKNLPDAMKNLGIKILRRFVGG